MATVATLSVSAVGFDGPHEPLSRVDVGQKSSMQLPCIRPDDVQRTASLFHDILSVMVMDCLDAQDCANGGGR